MNMTEYSWLDRSVKKKVHDWVDAHGIDHKRCIGYDVVGGNVVFHLHRHNEYGTVYVDEATGELVTEDVTVPMRTPPVAP
jgi:hypothetical protein